MTRAIADQHKLRNYASHDSQMADSTARPQAGLSVGTDRVRRPDDPPSSEKAIPGQYTPDFLNRAGPIRVLVAEDNFANQLIAKTLLTRAGYTVTTADDGAQATQLCKDAAFDLILMDIEMPEMSGIEATEAIRNSAGPNTNTIIIALTAYGSATERYVYRHSGINHVLSKPFKIAQLNQFIGHEVSDQTSPHIAADYPARSLDEETLQALLEAAGAIGLSGIIKPYWRSAYAMLADMQDAQQRFDRDRLQKSAHALKGASINIGLPALARLCAQLQNAKTEAAPELLDLLETEMAKSRKALTLRLENEP